ncbi:hypothetical protein EJ05DRAFT_216255 [Pseudovirgaria hyperparasitica]|uniref:Uncharacterized protein n=1 Tax=Pseudovirgaria hyperparasitica TaxID=470096 RepID=A0A6A6VTC7_9PEZI|nr:uncharacterized protein EJ05DRAFT_216255 [Pseudovirgaria hyperparasitica]KAF2753473.1 hypothetical protein EJ05DRAFT_216255 [Pseudovirgaria hyperparasitica]
MMTGTRSPSEYDDQVEQRCCCFDIQDEEPGKAGVGLLSILSSNGRRRRKGWTGLDSETTHGRLSLCLSVSGEICVCVYVYVCVVGVTYM